MNTARPYTDALDEAMIPMLRAKSGQERLCILNGMYRSAWGIVECSIRAAHPKWEEEAVHEATSRRMLHGAG